MTTPMLQPAAPGGPLAPRPAIAATVARSGTQAAKTAAAATAALPLPPTGQADPVPKQP